MADAPPEDASLVDSTALLASLYQGPLRDFVARRASLVSQLKRTGHKDVAARLASSGKPSRVAHLVNRVYWRARDVYEAVLDAGSAARAAQQARLLGNVETALPEVIDRRDEAIRAATDRAVALARNEMPAADTLRGQVRTSFEALAAHGSDARLPHGHFIDDVALPGLAAFAGLVLPPTPEPDAPVRRFEVVARRATPPTADAGTPPDPRLAEAESRAAALREREAAVADRLEALRQGTAAAEDVAVAAERAATDAARVAAEARQAVEKAQASGAAVQADLDAVRAALSDAETEVRQLSGPAAGAGPRPAGSRPTPGRATPRPSGPGQPVE
ncbi:MAG: hypothetical protein IT182_16995 [Acidobacteria bacterium]|nr:hypothetical protein [Acidobacteriota bacterium]